MVVFIDHSPNLVNREKTFQTLNLQVKMSHSKCYINHCPSSPTHISQLCLKSFIACVCISKLFFFYIHWIKINWKNKENRVREEVSMICPLDLGPTLPVKVSHVSLGPRFSLSLSRTSPQSEFAHQSHSGSSLCNKLKPKMLGKIKSVFCQATTFLSIAPLLFLLDLTWFIVFANVF